MQLCEITHRSDLLIRPKLWFLFVCCVWSKTIRLIRSIRRFFNVASPLRHPLPLRTHARTLNKIQTMKPRKQNKNLASSDKTTVVLFVIQLFLLFDKTESGEPSDSTDSTDSTDSMHSDILARSAKINISAVGTTLPILARRAVIFSAKRGPTELAEPTEPTEPTDSMRIKHNKQSLTRTTIKNFFQVVNLLLQLFEIM